MDEEETPTLPAVSEQPMTVDQLLPWCDEPTRKGIETALLRMQVQYQAQRNQALEAENAALKAKPKHDGRVPPRRAVKGNGAVPAK